MIAKDINHRRGSRLIHYFETSGDISNHEISFVVKPGTEITEFRVVDKNSLRAGEITLNFENERNRTTVCVNIMDADTYSLKSGNYYYDLDDLTVSDTIASGIFILSADVQTPFDNLETLPSNLSRAILLQPGEVEDDTFIYKITENEKERFTGLTTNGAREILGITLLENNKVDKETGKGLSEINLSPDLKNSYDTAYNERHIHSNKSNLDAINQMLGTTNNAQFNQLGLGRGCLSSWSLALNSGLSTKTGTYLDWEGGNARIRENMYNLEFSSFDGSNLVNTFKTSSAGNVSYKPLFTNGMIYKAISVSANTALTANDHIVLVTTSAADKTITLPVAGIPDGTVYNIKKIDSGNGKVIVQGASGMIDGLAVIELVNQYNAGQFVKWGSNYYIFEIFI